MATRANLIEYLCSQQHLGWRQMPEATKDRKRLQMATLLSELEDLGLLRHEKTPAT